MLPLLSCCPELGGPRVTLEPQRPRAGVSAPRVCHRCNVRPPRIGQRWCRECFKDYRAARRTDPRPVRPQRRAETADRTLGLPPEETAPADEKAPGGAEIGVVRKASASGRKRPSAKGGPKVPPDWRARFLRHYARHGTRWRSARAAGISHDTLERAERADPQFAARVEEARRVFVESLESSPAGGFLQQFRRGNVVAGIVLAKRHDPANYIERALTVNANLTASLDPQAGAALLATMLGQLPLAPPLPDARILPVRPDPVE